MIITPIDHHKNLFYIENAFSQEIVEQLKSEDPFSYPYRKEEMQDIWPRRRLEPTTSSVYNKLTEQLNNCVDQISTAIGYPVFVTDTGIWLDEPGFSMGKHLDNDAVVMSMQIYLNDNPAQLGTTFYNKDGTVRHQLPYKFNCGYMMINGPEQYHGMTNPVPENSYRISSYSWIRPKS